MVIPRGRSSLHSTRLKTGRYLSPERERTVRSRAEKQTDTKKTLGFLPKGKKGGPIEPVPN
jgi:hypothetical protein